MNMLILILIAAAAAVIGIAVVGGRSGSPNARQLDDPDHPSRAGPDPARTGRVHRSPTPKTPDSDDSER